MEKDLFMNKIRCEFVVITNGDDIDIVTEVLEIKPDRCFNKGDIFISEHSSRTGYRPYGLWAIMPKPELRTELDISQQLKYLQVVLGDKIKSIEMLKNQYHFECVFSISIETEDAGIGFDLGYDELNFINAISSRFSCSFIAKESIEK